MIPPVQRRLLLVFAHPDDESVFAAGLACMTVAEGGRVALCTATPGDKGKVGDPPVCPRERLGAVRQAEVMAACATLGIGTVRVLGYPDRGLAFAPTDTIRRQLVEIIRAARPHVVVTFDPNGSNLHPDHVAISRFTSDAVAAAGDGRWFPELGAAHAVGRLLWTLPVRPWDVMRRTDPALEPGADFVLDVSAFAERKMAALLAHRTQMQSLNRIFFSKPDVTRLLGVEMFRQAFGPPLVARPAADVFAEIVPTSEPRFHDPLSRTGSAAVRRS
ncbi:MAG: PIG-L family deacetylase [Vicinamibacterales bacterium]|jgi:LmbE family N-acetylglucosaminyl deacetylase|nr:PIG-L family deacetylase [Vicinamibacterales bacterium]